MTSEAPAYELWSLVVINVVVFAIFALSFNHPRTARDWRSFGAFTAFLVALFTRMYGFPLTIYLLSGWFRAPLCWAGPPLPQHRKPLEDCSARRGIHIYTRFTC